MHITCVKLHQFYFQIKEDYFMALITKSSVTSHSHN